MSLTVRVARLGLIFKRPSYRPTGTQPFPRSVLVWRPANKTSSWLSTGMLTLCTHWSLTGNTEPPHWVVTCGRRWSVCRPPYSETVTRKGSILRVLVVILLLKQESAFLVTTNTIAATVTPESGLAQEDLLTTPTRVETRPQGGHQIMEKNTSKPWVTFWSSNKNGLVAFQDHSRKLNVVKQVNHGVGNKCCFWLVLLFFFYMYQVSLISAGFWLNITHLQLTSSWTVHGSIDNNARNEHLESNLFLF